MSTPTFPGGQRAGQPGHTHVAWQHVHQPGWEGCSWQEPPGASDLVPLQWSALPRLFAGSPAQYRADSGCGTSGLGVSAWIAS